MPAPDAVKRLVENFDTNREHYRSAAYNETQLRRQFLDPFWEALGWDVNNREGNAPAYTDVIHEASIKIRGGTRAPDYAFSINGGLNPSAWKFFVEAKAPCVNLKDHPDPALQVRRYGWSAKLALSVLSDFEEFAAYDCRIKPGSGDKAHTARTLYITYDQYEDRWDEIADIFSRDAVRKGSFDRYAEGSKKKRGTAEVDDAFLAEIERWRELLARNFALRNPGLSVHDLNFAVQKTIDRLIFLRICEDRGTEDYGRLLTLANGANTYPRLLEHFRLADDRYNSGLFHFRDERGRPGAPDQLTPDLRLDDKALKDILKNLYYPESPYEFSVLPADILGQVYEQFLGKTIRLTPAHQARIEEKPEVRKAGGVYYTPKYIVDYIVENTLGRLLNGTDPEKPKPIPVSQAEKLKVLDPACGSGSFLIVAYQFLLDWHLDQYTLGPDRKPDEGKITRHAAGKTPRIYRAKGGEWRLTTAEKKRILLNNIHGVDIDSQAVEVTKLSLLLKVLEGETEQVVQRDFLKERQRILPDLGRNIRCGNSLIGPDFHDQPDLPELDDETRYRINVFDWESAFPEVFAQGGFDCVIGNPPYVRIQRIGHSEADYLYSVYGTPTSKMDLSLVFLEKSLDLMPANGRASFICTSQWLSGDYGRKLRATLATGQLHEIVDFGSLPVFTGANTYPAIFTLSKTKASTLTLKRISDRSGLNLSAVNGAEPIPIDLSTLSDAPWVLSEFDLETACANKGIKCEPLSFFGKAYIGCKTGMNDAFVLTSEEANAKTLEKEVLLPYAYRGEEVERFRKVSPGSVVIYPYERDQHNRPELIPDKELKSRYPRVYRHLELYRSKLSQRQDSRRNYAEGSLWFRHLRPGNFDLVDRPKLFFKAIAKASCGGISEGPTAFDGANCPAVLLENLGGHSPRFLLGLLNSRLLSYYLRQVCPPKLSGYIKFSAKGLSRAPIRPIDFTNPTDVEAHDKMVALAERMLKLHEDQAGEKNPETLRRIADEIAATDRRIDRLVYQLYDLTDDEIALVEGTGA